jgi:predicted permease
MSGFRSNPLQGFIGDLRYAIRGLRNAPGYAATMILTLAVGLGAVTTMLAIVDSVLLRPIALPHAEELVTLSVRSTQRDDANILSYQQIDTLRCHATSSFSAIGSYTMLPRPIVAGDGNRTALLSEVNAGFFSMLGIHAQLGRLMTSADEKSPVAVVNATFWRERLHSDPKAVGAIIHISGQPRTVIGVMPDGVHFPEGVDASIVFMPLHLEGRQDDLFSDTARVLARMKSGVTLQQARAEAQSVLDHSSDQGRDLHNSTYQNIVLQSYSKEVTQDLRGSLFALLGGVAVLLLIACANAANLQIARVSARISEMSVRSALGASFSRLLRQIITESLVVSLLGAALGAAVAWMLVAIIRLAYGQRYARFDELSVHLVPLSVCMLLAVLAAVLASIAPMGGIRRQVSIAASTHRVTRSSRLPLVLVALQVAMTCVLLVISGLFVRTFNALQNVRLGFDPDHITSMVLIPNNPGINPEVSRQTLTALLDQFNALPGVQSATMQSSIPFSNFNVTLNGTTDVQGRAFQPTDAAFYSLVSTNFVHASGMHLLRGRTFVAQDESSGAMTVLVNQAFVQRYLSNREPIGAIISLHRSPTDRDEDMPLKGSLTVIGVVENELQGGDLGAPFQPLVYINYRQLPSGTPFVQVFNMAQEFAIRSTLAQSALDSDLRRIVHQAAPDMSEMLLQPMEKSIDQSLSERRLALQLVTGFGAVALLLAAIGIYGVLAFSVIQRRKEIGIRMALGSSRVGAIHLIVRQAGQMILAGFLVGAGAAWPAGRAVRSFLFGVQPIDPVTLSASAAILVLVCAIAAAVPAWRAAQVNPVEALRAE